MKDREKRVREAIAQNKKLINALRLQNQSLAALLPRQKKKTTQFPPRPAAKKGSNRVGKN
jgi:hypothetical protein